MTRYLVNNYKKTITTIIMNCPICLDPLGEDNIHTLECGHNFHTDCIVKWFRGGSGDCPSCRDNPEVGVRMWDVRIRSTMVIRVGNRKNAPPEIKRAVRSMKRTDKLRKEASADLTAFKREHGATIKEYRRLRSRSYRLKHQLYNKKRELGMMHCPGLPSVHIH